METTVRLYEIASGALRNALLFVEGIPVMRVIYSLVLLAVIAGAGRELISVRTRGKLLLAEFSYFIDGKKDAQHGDELRDETIRIYRMIVALMRIESENTKITSDEGPDGADREGPSPVLEENLLTSKVDQLSQVEITFQGLSIKALLSTLGNLTAPQNTEITAAIFADQPGRAFVSVAGSPGERRQLGIFADLPPEYAIENGTSDGETAFRIACFLVWIQWDKTEDVKAPDPEQGITFDEFCNWAKILVAKNRLRLTDPYRLAAEMKNADLGFIKTQFALAANLKLGYQALYASLYLFIPYVGSEGVDLGDGAETRIESLTDIIRLFSLMENSERDRDEPAIDWRNLLKESDRTRLSITRAYFASSMFTDCDAPAGVSALAGIKNVVRIVTGGRTPGQRVQLAFATMSGLAYADETVVNSQNVIHLRILPSLPCGIA